MIDNAADFAAVWDQFITARICIHSVGEGRALQKIALKPILGEQCRR